MMSLFSCSCCDKTQKFRRKKSARKKSLLELLCCIRSQTGGISAFRSNANFGDINIETDPNLRYSERPVTIQWNSPHSEVEQPLLSTESNNDCDEQKQIDQSVENSNENESDDANKSKKSKKSSFISYIRSNRSYNTKILNKDYF